jgi:hypothetical protein
MFGEIHDIYLLASEVRTFSSDNFFVAFAERQGQAASRDRAPPSKRRRAVAQIVENRTRSAGMNF